MLPGGAERIFRMAEAEQSHRMLMARGELDANVEAQRMEVVAARRGTWLGVAVSALSIIAATITTYWGAHPSVPIALVGVPLMSAVRAIILRK